MNDKELSELDGFMPLLKALRSIKKHTTSAPTLTPQNFLDQIQFYDDEDTPTPVRRVYFYLNGSWSYVTLT